MTAFFGKSVLKCVLTYFGHAESKKMSYQIFGALERPQNRDLINWVINNAPKVTCDGIFLLQMFLNVF